MHFRRQVVIAGAIADFASHRAKLIIEVDSGIHAANTDEAGARMAEADGYRILRVWNNDILQNMPGVCELIHTMLNVSAPANEK